MLCKKDKGGRAFPPPGILIAQKYRPDETQLLSGHFLHPYGKEYVIFYFISNSRMKIRLFFHCRKAEGVFVAVIPCK